MLRLNGSILSMFTDTTDCAKNITMPNEKLLLDLIEQRHIWQWVEKIQK